MELIIMGILVVIGLVSMTIEEIKHPYDCKLSPEEIRQERIRQGRDE